MKKWLILILALVFCALVGVYYYLGTKPVAPGAAPVAKQAARVFTMSACLKMPPEKIRAAHWATRESTPTRIEYGELQKISRLMTGYYTCLAASSRNPDMCNNLPERCCYTTDIKEDHSPRSMCANEYRIFAFSAYMAGKSKNDAACKDFLASDHLQGGMLPEQEFCRAASGGMENICASFDSKGKLPVTMKECRQVFPVKLEDCLNSADCRQMWQIYRAVSSGGTMRRRDYYQPTAAAYLQKSSRHCQEIADKLISAYCKFQNEAIGK